MKTKKSKFVSNLKLSVGFALYVGCGGRYTSTKSNCSDDVLVGDHCRLRAADNEHNSKIAQTDSSPHPTGDGFPRYEVCPGSGPRGLSCGNEAHRKTGPVIGFRVAITRISGRSIQ
ncbi:TPA: hypothetical protein N2A65_005849 [Pseudomonas aeruginosa]|nr:hypothetical protein [Pseudomonas aeruginosa]